MLALCGSRGYPCSAVMVSVHLTRWNCTTLDGFMLDDSRYSSIDAGYEYSREESRQLRTR